MNKYHSSARPHHPHIDTPISSDCSQNSNKINLDYSRNNHNSSSIQYEDLLKTSSRIDLRKKRTNLSYNHQRWQPLFSSIHLLLIRLVILLIMCWICYYIFLSIYPKPKKRTWERVWHNTVAWLIED